MNRGDKTGVLCNYCGGEERYIYEDGVIVGVYCEDCGHEDYECDEGPPYDHATKTGMYDHY